VTEYYPWVSEDDIHFIVHNFLTGVEFLFAPTYYLHIPVSKNTYQMTNEDYKKEINCGVLIMMKKKKKKKTQSAQSETVTGINVLSL